MGQLDNQRSTQGGSNPPTAEETLKVLTQQLQNLQQDLLLQLKQEVRQLQTEKSRLSDDIEYLRSQYQHVKHQQQTDQQQQLTQQLAQVMVSHLREQIWDRLNTSEANAYQPANNYNENLYGQLSSLESTLNTSLKSLQQDISSYQSALSQQLGRMQSLEQQGEAILEALVSRIKLQLQQNARNSTSGSENAISFLPPTSQLNVVQPVAPSRPSPEPPATPPPPPSPRQASAFTTGVILILISSLMFSLQNVVVRVILKEQPILGLFKLGGFITPSPGNSLLILAMRMVFVVPLMAFIVAPWRYPNTWRDIKQLGNPEQRGRLFSVVGSGFFLFLSQFFIYIALGNIPTGVATTIFFIYPTVTILLAWAIFSEKPTFLLVLATISIYIGGYLTIPTTGFVSRTSGNVGLGVATAAISGIAFAIYVILIKVSKWHPIPFSVVNFSTILVLSVAVMPFVPHKVIPANWPALWIGALVLTVTTLIGYLLNNIGVPLIGPALASVIGASGPALTGIIALVVIQEKLNVLQILGVVLVTVWVLGISVENTKKLPPTQPAKK